MNYFTIDEKLPSFNDYQLACRRNKYEGAKLKADVENLIYTYVRWGIVRKTLFPVKSYPVEIRIEWHERTKKRDVDNIQSSKKFILDALVKQGILTDDGRKYVKQIHDTVKDDVKDYVFVEIIENGY